MNIVLYVVGVIAAYIITRKVFKDEDDSWIGIFVAAFISMFSWVAFGIVFILYLLIKLFKNTSKPPKWL